ncbi:hypothetical protein ACFE04_022833 [Oxalis oulophora]
MIIDGNDAGYGYEKHGYNMHHQDSYNGHGYSGSGTQMHMQMTYSQESDSIQLPRPQMYLQYHQSGWPTQNMCWPSSGGGHSYGHHNYTSYSGGGMYNNGMGRSESESYNKFDVIMPGGNYEEDMRYERRSYGPGHGRSSYYHYDEGARRDGYNQQTIPMAVFRRKSLLTAGQYQQISCLSRSFSPLDSTYRGMQPDKVSRLITSDLIKKSRYTLDFS